MVRQCVLIGSKHRVRWLTAGDSMKKAICHFGPLWRTNHKNSAHHPPSFDLPTAGHTHLTTLNYSHCISKHAYMTSIQLPHTSHCAGHPASRGRHTFALHRARCITMPTCTQPGHDTHTSLWTDVRGRNMRCAQGGTICAGVCTGKEVPGHMNGAGCAACG